MPKLGHTKFNWIGSKFGMLTIIEIIPPDKAVCLCDCGNKVIRKRNSVKFGSHYNCGCFRREVINNPGTEKALKRPKGAAGLDLLYSNLRYQSKKRKIEFNLTKQELLEVSTKNCFYCDQEPYRVSIINNKIWGKQSTADHGKLIFNPLDRIDSNKGYVADNIVACCKNCNYAKNVLSVDEFKNMIIKIYKHLKLGD